MGRRGGIEYPVAIDSSYEVWHDFGNHYWPAVYIADAEGRIRHHHFGEGGYEECERVVQQAAPRSGASTASATTSSPSSREGFQAQADWANLSHPRRTSATRRRRTSLSRRRARREATYVAPDRLGLNQWALVGRVDDRERGERPDGPEGRIPFRFHARDVHLVLGPRERGVSVPFRVPVDGEPPGGAHGLDVDEDGRGKVADSGSTSCPPARPYRDRTFEIVFTEPGVEAYVFTFG